MKTRDTIPERCDQPATWVSNNAGFRACSKHAADGMTSMSSDAPGPCDYPMDNLGAARYHKPEQILALRKLGTTWTNWQRSPKGAECFAGLYGNDAAKQCGILFRAYMAGASDAVGLLDKIPK